MPAAPGWTRRISGVLSTWQRTIRISAVGALVAFGTLGIYLATGDKLDDLVLFVGGYLAGSLGSQVQKAHSQDRDERALSDAEALLSQFVESSNQSRSVSIGGLKIDDGLLVTASGQGRPYTQRVTFEFNPEPQPSRADPAEWITLERTRLPRLITEAKEQGRPFDNDPRVDLVGVDTKRYRPAGSPHTTKHMLRTAESTYFRFACMSNMLDEPYAEGGDARTLREIWDCYPSELVDLAAGVAPANIGINVVVVTTEDRSIVCHERARLFQVGAGQTRRRRIHFAAEGMLPSDRRQNGEPSPLDGARRALYQELAIEEAHDSDIEMFPTGVYLDTKRLQPIFCFVAYVAAKFTAVKARAPEAPDQHEAVDLYRRPFTLEDKKTRDLLLGRDPEFVLASNHAQISLLLALVQADGLDSVTQLLSERS